MLVVRSASETSSSTAQGTRSSSLVNSTGDFTEHHLVTNGASEMLVEIFGDKGRHARSAFGVAQIPLGSCLEIELIAEIE